MMAASAPDNEAIVATVRASHRGGYRAYGTRRVWHDLLVDGVSCGLYWIELLMRQQGLRARSRRRRFLKRHGEHSVIAGKMLDRQFTADMPNQRCVADFTCIWTPQEWIDVAARSNFSNEEWSDG